jgi:short subunit fatty acids transporter
MVAATDTFQELAKYPITTVIAVMVIVVFLYWFIIERPKVRKEQLAREEAERKAKADADKVAHEDRMHMAEEIAMSREVMKNQQMVIENSTAAMRAVTSSNEALKAVTEHQVERLIELRTTAHEDHGRMYAMLEETIQTVQRTEVLVHAKK